MEGGQGSEPAELFRDDARMAFAVFPVEALVDRIGRGVSWTAANNGQSVDYGLSSFPIAAQDAQDIERLPKSRSAAPRDRAVPSPNPRHSLCRPGIRASRK